VAAKALADELTEPIPVSSDDSDSESEDANKAEGDDNAIFQEVQQGIFDILSNSGLFWTLETEKQLILLFSWSLCSKVVVSDPQKNGVFVEFSSAGPSDDDLQGLAAMAHLPLHQLVFNPQKEDIFIPSTCDLDIDASKIKRELIGEPTKCWLAVSIPYYGEDTHELAVMDVFNPDE